MQVYLAGPITEDRPERQNWREEVTAELAAEGIRCVSPRPLMHYVEEYGLTQFEAEGVLTIRDHGYCTNSNFVLANFEFSEKASIGTSIELGWAFSSDVPIVAAIPNDNVHQHPMVLEIVAFRTFHLKDAVRLIKALNPDNGSGDLEHPLKIAPVRRKLRY